MVSKRILIFVPEDQIIHEIIITNNDPPTYAAHHIMFWNTIYCKSVDYDHAKPKYGIPLSTLQVPPWYYIYSTMDIDYPFVAL